VVWWQEPRVVTRAPPPKLKRATDDEVTRVYPRTVARYTTPIPRKHEVRGLAWEIHSARKRNIRVTLLAYGIFLGGALGLIIGEELYEHAHVEELKAKIGPPVLPSHASVAERVKEQVRLLKEAFPTSL
jgi:hypothetical protein